MEEQHLATAFPGVNVISSFNSGFIGFHKDQISLNQVADVVERLRSVANIPIFSDECIWRYCFSEINTRPLPWRRYPLFGGIRRFKQFQHCANEFVYAHFLLKHEGGLYRSMGDRVLMELESGEMNNCSNDNAPEKTSSVSNPLIQVDSIVHL